MKSSKPQAQLVLKDIQGGGPCLFMCESHVVALHFLCDSLGSNAV